MNAIILLDWLIFVMFAFICLPIPLAVLAILFRRNDVAVTLYATSLGAFYLFSLLISARISP